MKKRKPTPPNGSKRPSFGSGGSKLDRMLRSKRPPHRPPEGGESVPAVPKPKPTPLTDGAEAPVE